MQKLATTEGRRERAHLAVDILELIDDLDKALNAHRPQFNHQAVAMLLDSTAESKAFRRRRKYHVSKFELFDKLVDFVKTNNPNFESIVIE